MNKTKVLVLTQKGKWTNNIDDSITQRVEESDWDEKYPDSTSPIAKCGFLDKAFLDPVDLNRLSDEEGVFLVYDSIDMDRFEELKQQCEGDEVFVLAHTSGTCLPNSFNNWHEKTFVLSGSHTNSEEGRYYPLFDILTDSEGDKLPRIINTIFKPQGLLDLVLQYLHQCLFAPKSKDELNKLKSALLEKLPDNSDAKKALRNYTTNTSTGLENLRDKLLDFALNNH